MSRTMLRRSALAAVLAIGAFWGFAGAQTKTEPFVVAKVSVITQPSSVHRISFAQPGIVREKLVKDGDQVKKDQPLMRQDTDLDQKELEILKVEAESESRIEAAKAEEKVRKIDFDRKMGAKASYNASEIEESEARYIEAQKGVKVAQEDHDRAKLKYDQQAIKLMRMEVRSPVDGEVRDVLIEVGDMADPQSRDGAIVVVNNNPLDIEIRGLTTKQVSTLKKGDKLQVRYLNDGAEGKWLGGELYYISPVAEATADRQLVKLALPNAEGRASGLRMELKLTEGLQKTAPKDDAILSYK